MRTASLGLTIACSVHDDPSLVLEGPDQVQVYELGPVDGPVLRLTDGSRPQGLHWRIGRREVADVGANGIVARGSGRTPITVRWRNQRITWTLVVDLETELQVSGVPSKLRPGDVARLDLEAIRSGQPVAVGEVIWASSDPRVLDVVDGRVRALSPGRAFVTAQTNAASAMVELAVEGQRH